MKIFKILAILIILTVLGCGEKAELGTKKNPIKMYFVPSLEAGKIVTSGKEVADYLHEETGYYFKVAVPTSYASVIEALGTDETDIAWLATFAYILANEKFGAEVALTTVRNGLEKYRGQFLAHTDSDINSIEDIEGKVIAYTDAASTSGYLYPSALLAEKSIKPKDMMYAGGHPQVILAVYQKTVDAGCTFWSPKDKEGNIRDARRTVLDTYPDVLEKVKIVGYTDWIPNDTVTFRKNFPAEMRENIVQSLLDFAASEEGHEVLMSLLDIDNFVRADDSDYDVVRKTLNILGTDPAEMIK
ncbi:MAG: phosphate/phosphite/phosphonate ABC transporter substrate-binding protein [Candidatus Cloacimonetes bacterium]|nr:phosphate/phosphite/phosphonate ABC transporter substrate-binding protein [Candidatus Cloacimonadota bacterium]MCF7814673.1 phosphate/phosphite/phosphonate ABC transporter substrate-binding protein [Candidatus Cloacimonadota bacterium]MCF7868235.1 phosphate/phosphite/phosphonate ABC transporter substrate-binding protein [Candidatus Cloacimonadota bacterium]MCF7883668.1 phosphate/phosphite/phosphonate ABC transporter substrate-binding protein [Candidatus Cloacimonadota bacterium]